VAVIYDLKDGLPPYVIRSSNVLRRKLERARFKVQVQMRPLSNLPPDVEVVFAPKDLLETAGQAAPGSQVMPLEPEASYQPAFDMLLEQLASGQALHAQRLEPEDKKAPGRRIVRYRGSERLE
jgi:mannitol-specific phosphotransferase system IIBC component